MSLSYLEYLKKFTTVVADTGDIEAIKRTHPQDSTTNPSLILAVAKQTQYEPFVRQIIQESGQDISLCMQLLLVGFGEQIVKVIPGRVSIEVDARLSYDRQQTISYAQKIIDLFAKRGIDRSRVLIKIASTWEGVQAAKELEKQGIHCNLTLLFSFAQAVICAEAGVTLISPFVGRILDWYRDNQNFISTDPQEDPGVKFVTKVYHYYKKHGYQTEIMGASFRNSGEIMQLSGCDLLTISPVLIEELDGSIMEDNYQAAKLSKQDSNKLGGNKLSYNQQQFIDHHNQDLMAKEKLAEGIERFCQDTIQLEEYIRQL